MAKHGSLSGLPSLDTGFPPPFCASRFFAAPSIDFSRAHASNPRWTRHARFHVVWQIVSQCLFAALAGWMP
jgi:hypothetical protein